MDRSLDEILSSLRHTVRQIADEAEKLSKHTTSIADSVANLNKSGRLTKI